MPPLKLDELRWEDPPAPIAGPGRPSVYPAIVTELKLHPSKWALIAVGTTGGEATSVRSAAQRMAIGGKVEAVTRQHEGNGLRATYARWVPDGVPDAD